jgi:peptide/nickel transport system ATP-binding protein
MLSGGQQQRVVIARALILRPTMIIADEPVSMLDASVRVEILNLLRSIQQARNLTLAFITHDLSTVRHFAERIFVMYAGKIIEQAQVDDLLEHPQHPYTEALLAAIADPDPDNAAHQRAVPAASRRACCIRRRAAAFTRAARDPLEEGTDSSRDRGPLIGRFS